MTDESAYVSDVLRSASKLRVPRYNADASARYKIEGLADYMLESALHQGDLEQERLEAHEQLATLDEEWENLTGWEPFRQGKTDSSIERAKAQLRPDLAKSRKWLDWQIDRLSEQIERIERDATKVSRTYTMYGG